MKKQYILFFVILFTCACSDIGKSIIESISKPQKVIFHKSKVVAKLEDISGFTSFKDTENLKVVKVYVNDKGPFNFAVMFEDGLLDSEFKTGIILSKTLDKIGGKLRTGKIHFKVDSLKISDLELKDFAVEVYAPKASEIDSPIHELDGVLTYGMIEGLNITFNKDYSEMIISDHL